LTSVRTVVVAAACSASASARQASSARGLPPAITLGQLRTPAGGEFEQPA